MIIFPSSVNALGHDWQSLEPATTWERAWVERAMECSKDKYDDPYMFLSILRMETHPEIQVPESYRGMVLAAACNESRFKPDAVGDGRESVGILQIRESHYKGYVGNWGRCNYFNRKDPIGNARCWLWRIRTAYDGDKRPGIPLARRRCGFRKGWTTAWVWIAVGPSPKGKMWECFGRPPRSHNKRFSKFKKDVNKRLKWHQLRDMD